jgi:hypothetical protein
MKSLWSAGHFKGPAARRSERCGLGAAQGVKARRGWLYVAFRLGQRTKAVSSFAACNGFTRLSDSQAVPNFGGKAETKGLLLVKRLASCSMWINHHRNFEPGAESATVRSATGEAGFKRRGTGDHERF